MIADSAVDSVSTTRHKLDDLLELIKFTKTGGPKIQRQPTVVDTVAPVIIGNTGSGTSGVPVNHGMVNNNPASTNLVNPGYASNCGGFGRLGPSSGLGGIRQTVQNLAGRSIGTSDTESEADFDDQMVSYGAVLTTFEELLRAGEVAALVREMWSAMQWLTV